MTTPTEKFLSEAMRLPRRFRVQIAKQLLASLEEEEEADVAWRQEATRRLAEIERGEVSGIPWEEIEQSREVRYRENG